MDNVVNERFMSTMSVNILMNVPRKREIYIDVDIFIYYVIYFLLFVLGINISKGARCILINFNSPTGQICLKRSEMVRKGPK